MIQALPEQIEDVSSAPDRLQNIASNPTESIWVSASAGTGKTKVLTDRVLRLLLPRDDGTAATPPHRILCLTFTKAAASEMAQRINTTLGEWAVMPVQNLENTENSLMERLFNLLGRPPSEEQIMAAQRLFANVMDVAGGLQIMTIHSFCQSVLGRFSLEADLPPNFTVLEDKGSAELLVRAQAQVLREAQSVQMLGSPLSVALVNITREINEEQFFSLLQNIRSERYQLERLFSEAWNTDGVHTKLCAFYGIAPHLDEQQYLQESCEDFGFDFTGLLNAAQIMLQGKGKGEQESGRGILAWLRRTMPERMATFPDYCHAFLTKGEGTPKARMMTKDMVTAYPDSEQCLRTEAARLVNVCDTLKRIKSATLTRDMLLLGHEVMKRYAVLKQEKGGLDFDDLILRTLDLLKGRTGRLSDLGNLHTGSAQWIMYKLDQGLDHILVDEAQDTNPEQWKIIEALCEEFFAGFGARDDVLRTSFTVGDVKQSIYSFQRAEPEEFRRMQGIIQEKIETAGKTGRPVALETSFRSTQAVLDVVDSVFRQPEANRSVGGEVIRHISWRKGQAGLVELWPLFETPKKEKQLDFWSPPVQVRGQASGGLQLARYIADKIDGWLKNGEELPSHGRKIAAGDIMILMRTRSKFVDVLLRELKLRKIPVSGVDRMVLSDQLAVQDLLALARFCLLPEDDLTLACILKSSFMGWSEDELFTLGYNRKGTLWAELCYFDSTRLAKIEDLPKNLAEIDAVKTEAARSYLSSLITKARNLGAYEFFCSILYAPCPADDRSGMRSIRRRLGAEAVDPIDELLNAALSFSSSGVDQLQLFVQQQEQEEIEIKRELEEAGQQVRIMTIHGSKGLQAPIVIMPDTIMRGSGGKQSRLLWPNRTKLDMPLWTPRKGDSPEKYQKYFEACVAMSEEEQYRLLYVAMTRAADRLYIAGHQGSNQAKENSWYFLIRKAMQDLGAHEGEDDCLRMESSQEAEPDKTKKQRKGEQKFIEIPDVLLRAVDPEPSLPRPLVPSKLSEEDQLPAALSPLKAGHEFRFLRGNMTHKLLQFLPDIDPEKREEAAAAFTRRYGMDIPPRIQEEIVSEVMVILRHADFAPFFQKGSMAEVPITGVQEGRVISGQIDRLLVTQKDIWILDYKTNRPPPEDPKDVPMAYHRQMEAYRSVMRAIYPNHTIHCALLWTDGARLMIL